MPLVMLKKDWPNDFHRNIRDGKGAILDTLKFSPGEPVDVPYDKLPAIAGDLFKALFPITLDNGKPVAIPEEEFRQDVVTAPVDIEHKTSEDTGDGAITGRRSRK